MTIDNSVRRIASPRFEFAAGGGIAAVVIFSVGVFMLVVPILGWIIGPGLMLTGILVAIWHFGGIFRNKANYAGHCPYCGAVANVGSAGSVAECPGCQRSFIHRDGKLNKLDP